MYRGVYNPATNYEINDVVSYGGNSYVYINRVAGAGNAPSNTTYWSNMVDGLSDLGDYDNATTYQKNDLVRVSGLIYRAKQTTVGNTPPNATYWALFLEGFKYKGLWDNSTAYKVNDVAMLNGINYIATANNLSLIHI